MNYFQYIIFLISNFVITVVMYVLRPIDILTITCFVAYNIMSIIRESMQENGQLDFVKMWSLFRERYNKYPSLMVHGRIIFALIILLIFTIWN